MMMKHKTEYRLPAEAPARASHAGGSAQADYPQEKIVDFFS